MEKKVTSPIVKGLLITLLLAIIDLVGGFAHLKTATWYGWISLIILMIAIIWACVSFGTQSNGNVTFGNVFAYGFKTSAVVACILLLYTMLSMFVIFPETKDLALEQARKQMEEKGTLSEAQVDQAVEWTSKFFIPFAMVGVILGTLIFGVIASLIGAAVTKKNPQSPFENQA
jgi:amino acid transporter